MTALDYALDEPVGNSWGLNGLVMLGPVTSMPRPKPRRCPTTGLPPCPPCQPPACPAAPNRSAAPRGTGPCRYWAPPSTAPRRAATGPAAVPGRAHGTHQPTLSEPAPTRLQQA